MLKKMRAETRARPTGPVRPVTSLVAGREFLAGRYPVLRVSARSSALLGVKYVQSRLISVWGLILTAALCPPTIFTAFAIYASAVNLIAIASLLRFETVFFRDSDPLRLGVAFRLASVVGAGFLAVAAATLTWLAVIGLLSWPVVTLLWLSLAARSAIRLVISEATAEGDFRTVGNSGVVPALLQPIFMLLLILCFGPRAVVLFAADAFGHMCCAAFLLHRRRSALAELVHRRHWSQKALIEAAYRWRDAALVQVPAEMLAYGFVILPVLALPAAGDPIFAGHVALAMRLLDVPAQMFGSMTGPIVLNRLRSSATRRRFWARIVTIGLLAGVGATFAVIAASAYLVDSYLGGWGWGGMGLVMAMLTPFFAGVAAIGPLQQIAALSPRSVWQVLANAIGVATLLAVIEWFGTLSMSLLLALGVVSVARALIYAVLIWLHLEDAVEG